MKKDEFERLNEIATEMEATAQTKAEEMQMEAIRCGLGILQRFLVAFEKIAAQGETQVIKTTVHPPLRDLGF